MSVRRLTVLVEPVRKVRAYFVQYDRDVRSRADQLTVSTPDKLAIVSLRLHNKQHFIHQCCQTDSWTGLIQRRHVEDEIIEVTTLEVSHKSEEFLKR